MQFFYGLRAQLGDCLGVNGGCFGRECAAVLGAVLDVNGGLFKGYFGRE